MKYVAILESQDGDLRFFNHVTEEQTSRPLLGIRFVSQDAKDSGVESMRIVDDGACPIRFDPENPPDYFEPLYKRGDGFLETNLYAFGLSKKTENDGTEPACGLDKFRKKSSSFYKKVRTQLSALYRFKNTDANRESVFDTPNEMMDMWVKMDKSARELDESSMELRKEMGIEESSD